MSVVLSLARPVEQRLLQRRRIKVSMKTVTAVCSTGMLDSNGSTQVQRFEPDMALVKKSREVWKEISGILLSDTPNLDASEHVGILTVIGGVRPVALLLDVAESEIEKLVRLLKQVHLIAFVGRVPEPVCTWQSPHPAEITCIFRSRLESSAFWVCRNKRDVHTINKGIDQVVAAQLLCYPGCCIDAHQQDNAEFEDALVRGWTREFGDDPERIAKAWREDRKVPIEFEPKVAERVPRTHSLFPFVQHIACESCLRPGDTPTARLNSAYRELVSETDPALYEYLVGAARRSEEKLRS
jgi:hypothetical protein